MSWSRRTSYYGHYFERRPKANVEKFKKGRTDLEPVVIEGRTIASTFWGKRWCSHFDNMADYENRLPRGRTYVRNGSVLHLEITPGHVQATVAGSDFYTVNMEVDPLPLDRWENIKRKCQGRISTIIDLLMGTFSPEVMEVVCDPVDGLFPLQSEIKYDCSCPDWASLCKHVAATFYGIGNRLDKAPELLFLLRRVNPVELLTSSTAAFLAEDQTTSNDSLHGDVGAIFGIDLATVSEPVPQVSSTRSAKSGVTAKTQQAPARISDDELKEAIDLIAQSRTTKSEQEAAQPKPEPKKRGRKSLKNISVFEPADQTAAPAPQIAALGTTSVQKSAPISKATLPTPVEFRPAERQTVRGKKIAASSTTPLPTPVEFRPVGAKTAKQKVISARVGSPKPAVPKVVKPPEPQTKGRTGKTASKTASKAVPAVTPKAKKVPLSIKAPLAIKPASAKTKVAAGEKDSGETKPITKKKKGLTISFKS